jgi:hypothetical protein
MYIAESALAGQDQITCWTCDYLHLQETCFLHSLQAWAADAQLAVGHAQEGFWTSDKNLQPAIRVAVVLVEKLRSEPGD